MPIAESIAALTAAVSAGSTLAGTTMSGLMGGVGYNVACGIEVENWTKWPLSSPHTHIKGGQVKIPATVIAPGKREAMLTHKVGHTATGTYGTVSWRVEATMRFYIMLMWSVPYNHHFYSNWLAIGITKDRSRAYSWGLFNDMYYNRPSDFVRAEYYRSAPTIKYSNDLVEISATMGTSHKPTIKVMVRPKDKDNLAASLKHALSKYKRGLISVNQK